VADKIFLFGILDRMSVNVRILHTCHWIKLSAIDKKLITKQCLQQLSFYLVLYAPLCEIDTNYTKFLKRCQEGIASIFIFAQQCCCSTRRDVLFRKKNSM